MLRRSQVASREFPIQKLSRVENPRPRPMAMTVVPPEDVEAAASDALRASNLSRDPMLVSLFFTLFPSVSLITFGSLKVRTIVSAL